MKKSAVIGALAALAQGTRLDIFRLLVQKGPEGLPAGEIGTRLGQPSPTLSFHLNQLRFAGLITSRRESRSIIYSANFKAMNGLLLLLRIQPPGASRRVSCNTAIWRADELSTDCLEM